MSRMQDGLEITPDILLRAYAIGLFPMAESASDPSLFWVDPEQRGIFPLDGLIVSKSLAKLVRSDRYEVRVDTDFDGVISACGAVAANRDATWINTRIKALYTALYARGNAHSVEVYADGTLVGGLYGVSLGAAFFGESMFHRARDASKVALVHLVARLRIGGYRLLDAQFVTDHLATLGAISMPRRAYHLLLADAVAREGHFDQLPRDRPLPGRDVLAFLRQDVA